MEIIKQYDDVLLMDGRVGTVVEKYPNMYVVEAREKDGKRELLYDVRPDQIKEVVRDQKNARALK